MHAADPICFENVAECVDASFADFWQRTDRDAIGGQSGNALRLFGYPGRRGARQLVVPPS